MAARSKKSADERRLATLREIANEGANRNCLECHQRGPTYVDMTIASFVCTKCCGLLRGLNPPHRTKSITMTSFTDDEIAFIRNRGNEFNRYVYLGTYDERSNLEKESLREEHKVREFLVQKYERKRWYVDPEIAQHKMQLDRRQKAAAEQGVSLTGGSVSMPSKPPATFATRSQPVTPAGGELWSPALSQGPTSNSFSNDLFTLCKETIPPPVDPFKSSQTSLASKDAFDPFQSATTGQIPTTVISPPPPNAQPRSAASDFADFDAAFAGHSAPSDTVAPSSAVQSPQGPMLPLQSTSTETNPLKDESKINQSIPQADRYAALAELDELFSGQKSDTATKYHDSSKATSTDPWGNQQAGTVISPSNPFSPTGLAPSSTTAAAATAAAAAATTTTTTTTTTTNPWGSPATAQSTTSPNPFSVVNTSWGRSSPLSQGRITPTATMRTVTSNLAAMKLNGQPASANGAWPNGHVQMGSGGLFQNTQSQLLNAFPVSWGAQTLAQNGVKHQQDNWAVFGQPQPQQQHQQQPQQQQQQQQQPWSNGSTTSAAQPASNNGWTSTNGASGNNFVEAWPQQIPTSVSSPFIAARSASPASKVQLNKVLPQSVSMHSQFTTSNGSGGISNGSNYSNPFAANGAAGGVSNVSRVCSTSNPFL